MRHEIHADFILDKKAINNNHLNVEMGEMLYLILIHPVGQCGWQPGSSRGD